MTAVELNAQIWRDMATIADSEPKAFAKAQRFIEELKVHPKEPSNVSAIADAVWELCSQSYGKDLSRTYR